MSDDLVKRLRKAAQEAEQDAKLVADAIRATVDRFRAKGFGEQSLDDGVRTIYEETSYGGDEEELWMGRSRLYAQATLFRRKLLKGTLPKLDELAGLLKQLRDELPPDEDANQSAHWGCPADLVPGEKWCIWPGNEGWNPGDEGHERARSRSQSAAIGDRRGSRRSIGGHQTDASRAPQGQFQDRASGNVIVIAGGTPSDVRSMKNTLADAKRKLRRIIA